MGAVSPNALLGEVARERRPLLGAMRKMRRNTLRGSEVPLALDPIEAGPRQEERLRDEVAAVELADGVARGGEGSVEVPWRWIAERPAPGTRTRAPHLSPVANVLRPDLPAVRARVHASAIFVACCRARTLRRRLSVCAEGLFLMPVRCGLPMSGAAQAQGCHGGAF